MRKIFQHLLWPLIVCCCFVPKFLHWPHDVMQGSLILLVCVYMALRNWVFPKWLHGNELRVLRLDVIFASALVILFTNSLGGVLSEFFFLYYFLSIGSALLLGAGPSVGLILTVIACYLPDFPRTSANQLLFGSSDVVPFCLRLLFLLGVVPISAYFAKSYLLSQKLQKKIFILTSQKKKYEDALESIQDDVIAWGAFRIRSALSTTKNYLDAVMPKVDDPTREPVPSDLQAQYIQVAFAKNEEALHAVKELELRFSSDPIRDMMAVEKLPKDNENA